MEEGPAGNIGRLGNRVQGRLLKPALEEKTQCCRGDALTRLARLP